jgi:excinuclease ABC subunit C
MDISKELKKLPDKPGVYIMKDNMGKVIYVGKASVLKNRVRQYFQPSASHGPKTAAMVENVKSFEYIVTDSEYEALILECNLIKKYRPKFNIMLRDDKNYPYIKVTVNEMFPRIIITRRFERDGAAYYGPYSSMAAVKETVDLLRKVFPVRTCKRNLPRDIGKQRPCLYHHIGQCLAPCAGKVNEQECRDVVRDVCKFLDGEHGSLISKLKKQMEQAAENLEFEKAASLRDKISSLEHIAEKQKVSSTAEDDRDVIAHAAKGPDNLMQVLLVRSGKLSGSEYYILEKAAGSDESELFNSFIKQYYSAGHSIPREVLVEREPDDKALLEEWLGRKRGARVYIIQPKRGEKLGLVRMAAKNAALAIEKYSMEQTASKKRIRDALESLGEILGTDRMPYRIEAYDISNTGTSEIAASRVVFEMGEFKKSEYRRYRIKSIDTQNDYAAMQEVIYRRFCRDRDDVMPDLVLVDGGKGHVSSVCEVLNETGVDVPVAGMAKDDRHRTRSLVLPDREIELAGIPVVFRLIASIQEEAHRFALSYNRKMRAARHSKSELDEIAGIGPERKKALLMHFKSVKKIREATVEELSSVKGISENTARLIYEHFRNRKGDGK